MSSRVCNTDPYMKPRRKFNPDKFHALMVERGVSKRELGKRFNPENPDGGRTHVIALLPLYKDGEKIRGPQIPTPTWATVEKLAFALGVDVKEVTDPVPSPERVKRFFRLRDRQDRRAA